MERNKHMKNFYKICGGFITGVGFLFAFAAVASAASLTLSPSSKTVNVGDTLIVDVLLDTGGQAIDGVDIQALNYNPYNLQLQDSDSSTAGTQVQAGSLMPNTLANSVDTTNGKIVFSQVTNGGSTYTGNGKLLTITFKALVAGNTKLTLDYTQGSTTDSNVASQGSDILSQVTNGQFVINDSGSTPPSPLPGGGSSSLRLINSNGTFYLVIDNVRHGITNPGMLSSYGFTFAMATIATAQDMALPEGSLLTPGDGSLVKSKEDQTVYLISNQHRYGFVSASVFGTLGFQFSSVLLVTNPELQALPIASNLDNGAAAHLAGLDINKDGTVYWVGSDSQIHGYPSLDVYNSWHIPGDFTKVVPANAADMSAPLGSLVSARILQ